MEKYVYILKTSDNIYKIGVTKDVDKRIKQLQTGSTEKITLVDKFLSEYPFKLESYFHYKYKDNKVNGEWFYLSEENLNDFQKDCSSFEHNYKCLTKSGNPFI